MNDSLSLSIIAGSFAVAALVIRYLFYSKCTTVKCCGCTITRDTAHEVEDPEHSHNNTANSI